MKTVDIHSHIIPHEMIGEAGIHGPEFVTEANGKTALRVGSYRTAVEGIEGPRFSDPLARLPIMDEQGLDIVGVTVSPLAYLYWLPAAAGTHFAQVVNDALAKYCAAAPDRFFFMPTLPLQDIPASVKEMERTLAMGAKGFNIANEIMGKDLASDYLWPIYEKAVSADVPIFVHPYPLGQDGDPGDAADKTSNPLYDWHGAGMMLWMAGYLHQETVGIASLIFGGLFDRFPTLKFCFSHGGGAIPYQFGRFEYAAERMPANKAERPIREYLPNFYFDSAIHNVDARKFLVEFAGADQVLIGSNSPGWDAVDGVAMVKEMQLPRTDEDKILGGNAISLFKIDA